MITGSRGGFAADRDCLMSNTDQSSRWYHGISAQHWAVLAIASAGWVFDVYEGQLFTIFKTPMLAELVGRNAQAIEWQGNIGLAAFLLGGAAGGLLFGVLGDRFGRVRILSVTILVYSVFSALTALAHSAASVHLLRFLVALGAGGEWAVAAALVAETFPVQSRAVASGIFHASSVLGSALASLTGVVFVGAGAWRLGFVLGLAPALLVLWIRLSMAEPKRWRQAQERAVDRENPERAIEAGDSRSASLAEPAWPATPAPMGDLGELWGRDPWRTRALLGLGLATVGLATYWGIFAWSPELVREVIGASGTDLNRQAAASFAYMVMNFTGGLLGLLCFAPLASWRGRKFAFAVYHFGAAITAPAAFLWAASYAQAVGLLCLMAFFVLGMHAGYAIYFPELFPTRLRATGASACFNLGRVLGAGALLIRGSLGASLGLRWAVVVMSGFFWLGLVILRFAPETKGSELPE
jgi:MFS family permease